uniref:Rhomboid domain containing 2 n=1 Tax=Scleropages formosus TaxID=113540 RepID=A0A8C9R3V4_SCLFO
SRDEETEMTSSRNFVSFAFTFVYTHYIRVYINIFALHKLFTYSFIHENIATLLLSSGALIVFGGGLERSVGTVRFLHHLLLLPACAGLLHTLLMLLLHDNVAHDSVRGLIPATLALVGVASVRSLMRRGVLLGVSVPTASLPWVLVLVAHLVPGTVFLCNVLAVAVGQIYGKGWVRVLNISESRASVLDKKMPFRLLRMWRWASYLPASAEERQKILHPLCKPVPGSYPVQAYAPAASVLPTQAMSGLPLMYEGWQHSSYAHGGHNPPYAHHGHGHGHWHAAATSWSGSHWTQGSASAHFQNYTSPPPVLPAEPQAQSTPLTATGGFPADLSGPPLPSMSTHTAHVLLS